MFLDSCPAGDLETKLTTGKGAIFDIETWHAINHAISQQEAVRCRPSETIGRAIFDPKPLAILQDEVIPQEIILYRVGFRALLLRCATKPLDLA